MNKTEARVNTQAHSYILLHIWLRYHYGRPQICENPECSGVSHSFQWAKKPDCEYERKRENFMRLCSQCHQKMDAKPDTAKKISRALTGRKLSEATRKKLREVGKGKNSITVYQHSLSSKEVKEWKSITQASESTYIGRTTISNNLKGRSKTAGGYIWKYQE